MRIARLSDIERYDSKVGASKDEKPMADWARRQIESAFEKGKPKNQNPLAGGAGRERKAKVQVTKGESAGETSVGLALRAAFGDWFRNEGEVVQELMPFSTRRYRADYALPRYRICVEVMGWHAHGQHLKEHHKDRQRSSFFARHDWLMFEVSHGQALGDLSGLIDDIAHAMTLRAPTERSLLDIQSVPHKHGFWYRLGQIT